MGRPGRRSASSRCAEVHEALSRPRRPTGLATRRLYDAGHNLPAPARLRWRVWGGGPSPTREHVHRRGGAPLMTGHRQEVPMWIVCPHALVRCHGDRRARSERRGADSGRGESGTDRRADRASADHPEARDEGDRPSRGHGSRDADRRRCSLHVLDLRRQGPGQVHPHPRGRPRRVPPRQPPQQQDAPQHRSARGHRAGRRCGVLALGSRTQLGVLLQGPEPRPLRLSLRHGSGGHARRQRHVRPDPGRAQGRPAEGGPRVLRDAGRFLHQGSPMDRPASSRSAWSRPSTSDPTTSCSTAPWAPSPATTRSRPRWGRPFDSTSAWAART